MIQKIKIRKTEPQDAEAIQAIYACKNAYSNTLQLPQPTVDMWYKRLANIPDNVYSYVALINGEIVGNLGFEVMTNPRRRHVGSALLATAIDLADNWLNLQRIEITVYTDNEPAIALYQKFGFVIEGEAVDFAYRNGEYVNAYYMARIKSMV